MIFCHTIKFTNFFGEKLKMDDDWINCPTSKLEVIRFCRKFDIGLGALRYKVSEEDIIEWVAKERVYECLARAMVEDYKNAFFKLFILSVADTIGNKEAVQECQICGFQISETEIEEWRKHKKEIKEQRMLDPTWRELIGGVKIRD